MNCNFLSDFQATARSSLNYLQETIPFGLWMFTHANEENNEWRIIVVHDEKYGVQNGDVYKWSDSFCSRMTKGIGPSIAPDASQIEAYKNAPIAKQFEINSYVGISLTNRAGELFGTLCAIDDVKKDPAQLKKNYKLIKLIARMLMLLYEMEIENDELRHSHNKLIQLSETDFLTGLLNRRGWSSMLIAEKARCKRYGMPCAIAMIDLNNLKMINDQQGHIAGDLVLKKTAITLEREVRENDVIARLGGDEFAVFVYNSTFEKTKNLIERIKCALANENIDAAVGYCHLTHAKDFNDMIIQADKTMYRNKEVMKKPH